MLTNYSKTINTARLIGASFVVAATLAVSGIAHAAPDFGNYFAAPRHIPENVDLTALRYPNTLHAAQNVADVSGAAFALSNIDHTAPVIAVAKDLAPQKVAEFTNVTQPSIPPSQYAMHSALQDISPATSIGKGDAKLFLIDAGASVKNGQDTEWSVYASPAESPVQVRFMEFHSGPAKHAALSPQDAIDAAGHSAKS